MRWNLLSSRRLYDIEQDKVQLLSQKLAAKKPLLADYACNAFADKLVNLDIAIETVEKTEDVNVKDTQELLGLLKAARMHLLAQGAALWIMKSNEITQLGLKVGVTGIRTFNAKSGTDEI